MVTLNFLSAVAAATLLSMASAQTPTTSGEPSSTVWSITRPSQTVKAKDMVNVGCFNSSAPLEDHGEFKDGQSRGNCHLVCAWLNKPVMALSDGDHCWCGDKIPAADTKIDESYCDVKCSGFDQEICGGKNKLSVLLSGTQLTAPDYFVPPEKGSSSALSSSSTASSKVPQNAAQTSPPASSNNSGSGSNKTAIAVGAVVGVVALLAIIGGVFFFLRQRRRREVEEEFRRQANINSFTAGGKLHTSNSSVADSRLDPEFMNRRQSNGSIADNEDYSRRILKVTNA